MSFTNTFILFTLICNSTLILSVTLVINFKMQKIVTISNCRMKLCITINHWFFIKMLWWFPSIDKALSIENENISTCKIPCTTSAQRCHEGMWFAYLWYWKCCNENFVPLFSFLNVCRSTYWDCWLYKKWQQPPSETCACKMVRAGARHRRMLRCFPAVKLYFKVWMRIIFANFEIYKGWGWKEEL